MTRFYGGCQFFEETISAMLDLNACDDSMLDHLEDPMRDLKLVSEYLVSTRDRLRIIAFRDCISVFLRNYSLEFGKDEEELLILSYESWKKKVFYVSENYNRAICNLK